MKINFNENEKIDFNDFNIRFDCFEPANINKIEPLDEFLN
jgi:hypothetical protein